MWNLHCSFEVEPAKCVLDLKKTGSGPTVGANRARQQTFPVLGLQNGCVPSLLLSVPPRFRLAPRDDHAGELVHLVQEPGGKQEACCDANTVDSASYTKSDKLCYNNCTPPSSISTSFLVVPDKGE